jgi:methyl-accepting chemotaxis protein
MKRRISISTKMILLIISASALIYIISLGYISLNLKKITINDAKLLADAYSKQYSNFAKANLNSDFDISRTIAQAYLGYKNVPDSNRRAIYCEILKNVAENNPQFASVWSCWEIYAWDTSWTKNYGRYRFTYYRKEGQLFKKEDETLNTEGDDLNSLYYKIKINKEEFATNPYMFSYTSKKEDEILESSFCVPIVINDVFLGLAGVDITLDRFQPIISKIKPFDKGYAYLISDDGTIIAHSNVDFVGKNISSVDSLNNLKFKILDNISKGETFSFTSEIKDAGKSYVTYSPISLGKSKSNWSLCIVVPYDAIVHVANRNFYISLLVGLLGLIFIALVITYIAKKIIKPVSTTTNLLRKLATGEISRFDKIKFKTNDEIGDMAISVNKLIDGLSTTAYFAKQIGEGKLDSDFQPLSENDVLGNALLDMRKSLINAAEEENNRRIEDEKRNWTNHGIAMFGDILRQQNADMETLSFEIIKNLVKYLKANQGGIFILNDDIKSDMYLELTACYAYDRRKFLIKKIPVTEGLIGACYNERKSIFMTQVPKKYITITSGLGEEDPRSVLIVPLKLNEDVFGVIEIASFKKLEQFEIDFVEKIAESIASEISGVKINMRTSYLLEQSQQQAEEMKAQEEEMRQNMEELHATQEEMSRKEAEVRGQFNAIDRTNALAELDLEGLILTANDTFCKLYGYKREELIGKTYTVLFEKFYKNSEEHSIIWDAMNAGKFYEGEFKQFHKSGSIVFTQSSYNPILNIDGTTERVLLLSVDTTKQKAMMAELKQQAEILKSQEEELRQSMEELTATQDEIIKKESEIRGVLGAIDNSVATLELDLQGKILFANPLFLKMVDLNSKEIIDQNYRDLVSQEYANSKEYVVFWDRLRKGITQSGEYFHKFDNRELWFLETFTPVKNVKDEIYKIIVLIIDITERKKAETVQHVLFSILTEVNNSNTLNELFISIHKNISRILYAKNFYIALLDGETEMVSFPYFIDESGDPTPATRKFKRGNTEYVFRTRSPQLISAERWEKLAAAGEVQRLGSPSVSWLGVPLINSEDKVFGVMAMQSYDVNIRFNENDKNLFVFVAEQIAKTIERKKWEEHLKKNKK